MEIGKKDLYFLSYINEVCVHECMPTELMLAVKIHYFFYYLNFKTNWIVRILEVYY